LEYDPATFRERIPDPAALSQLMHTQSEQALGRLKAIVEQILRDESAVLA
jgi:hypothetical protein